MIVSENVLSVSLRMIFIPISSWLDLRVGWTLLKDLKKHNRLFIHWLFYPPNPQANWLH
jgi:hypothetical protein